MDHIELPFVKMSTNAMTPTRATEGSVGLPHMIFTVQQTI